MKNAYLGSLVVVLSAILVGKASTCFAASSDGAAVKWRVVRAVSQNEWCDEAEAELRKHLALVPGAGFAGYTFYLGKAAEDASP